MTSILKETDRQRLVVSTEVDVMGELLKMNCSPLYNYTLDVLKLYRDIQLERLKYFLSKKE